MSKDRVSKLLVSGLRSIENVALPVEGLVTLIGENGSGKSSLLESLEIMRQAAGSGDFISDVINKTHGGLRSLLRRRAELLRIGLEITGSDSELTYTLELAFVGVETRIISELLGETVRGDEKPTPILHKDINKTVVRNLGENRLVDSELEVEPSRLALTSLGVHAPPQVKRAIAALRQIECHVPFETRPLWQQKELGVSIGPRWPAEVEKADSLSRYGVNLPNCYQQLRNLGQDTWSRVLERAKQGLGEDLRDFRMPAFGRGSIELELIFGNSPDHPQSAESLSEGQLSYLAFIALTELNQRRSLLTFDEPEVHLHPGLLARVVGMLEETAATAPVIIATHSDRLLDALSEPAKSVVLCELDDTRTTRLRRLDPEKLKDWLEDYRGVGSIRQEGFEAHILAEATP